jgi:hypothetical protein
VNGTHALGKMVLVGVQDLDPVVLRKTMCQLFQAGLPQVPFANESIHRIGVVGISTMSEATQDEMHSFRNAI